MLDRTSPPALTQDFSRALPTPAIHKAGNLEIIHHRQVAQPVTKIDFVFKAGKWFEEKAGVSRFTAHLLEKGTVGHTAHEIANRLDSMGAFLEIGSDADYSALTLFTLNKFFKEVAELGCELIRDSNFLEEELETEKEIFLQQLAVNEQKNHFLASRALRKNIYGPNHPYGRPVTAGDVEKITREDLKRHHQKYIVPEAVFVTGQVRDEEMLFLQQQLAAFPERKENLNGDFPLLPGEKTVSIAREKSLQCSIRMGRRAIQSLHPDYPALSLLTHILGGYFGSRLMANIREEKGLTYGIYSHPVTFKNDSMLSIGADVSKKDVEEACKEIKKEWQKLREEPVESNELEVAKNHFLGSMQLQLANPFAVTEKFKWLRMHNLPPDYYTGLIEQIKDCTPEQLLRTAQQYLAEDKWTSVVAG